MSAKWRRSQAWDNQFFPGWAWPAKFVLQAFSSIWLAVMLLISVALYGILASVPIGLVALAPTYIVYGLTLIASIAVIAGLPTYGIARLISAERRALRFFIALGTFLILGVVAVWSWLAFIWPPLHYDPARQTGLRFFAEFCEQYQASTLRRLPGVEMSELEFYGWWPLRVILLAFVLNMVVATARRIEFNFKNLGVLTVHSGIITIALGSVYYHANKLEGDMVLFAGDPDATTGIPALGPPQNRFHDNTRVALHMTVGGVSDQYLIPGLPRYNDYNLDVISGQTAESMTRPPEAAKHGPNRDLSIPLSRISNSGLDSAVRSALRTAGFNTEEIKTLVDRGMTATEFAGYGDKTSKLSEDLLRELFRRSFPRTLSYRVIGYASYAELRGEHVKATLAERTPGQPPAPVWFMAVLRPGETAPTADAPRIFMLPGSPASRIEVTPALTMECTTGRFGGMTEERFRDLSERLPAGAKHGLVIEVPAKDASAAPTRLVQPIVPGSKVPVGATGFTVEVKELQPQPDFPIITPGYEGSTSSVAKVTITTPTGESYDRWVYHRFPEISQDFLPGQGQNGMPKRRAADPAIRISYIDDSMPISVFIDQPASDIVRAIIRNDRGDVTILPPSPVATPIPVGGDELKFVITDRWEHSIKVERPTPVPELRQDKRSVGTHDDAALAVEVTSTDAAGKAMTRIVWLPFTKYMDSSGATQRSITLPDGRELMLAFSRLNHSLPNMRLRLKDFEMIAYDHRGSPRDYQSTIEVDPIRDEFESYEHVASLNYPLRAPFMWSDSRNIVANVLGSLAAGLNPRQFKFSQAGWDANGWQQTQRQADMGMIKRPFAKFTILQVGNNPGIHVIALGGIMMGIGIPWAFYFKPYLVRREKLKIQKQLADGTYVKPGSTTPLAPTATPPVAPPAPQETAP